MDWLVVYVFNFVGCGIGAGLLFATGHPGYNIRDPSAFGAHHCATAVKKAHYAFGSVVARAVFANMFVCLAVILALASHTTVGKIFAIIWPIASFAAMGFEHTIANMYYFSLAFMMDCEGLSTAEAFANLGGATLGNVLGAQLIALAYWYVYMHDSPTVHTAHCFGQSHQEIEHDIVEALDANRKAAPAGAGGGGGAEQPSEAPVAEQGEAYYASYAFPSFAAPGGFGATQ